MFHCIEFFYSEVQNIQIIELKNFYYDIIKMDNGNKDISGKS